MPQVGFRLRCDFTSITRMRTRTPLAVTEGTSGANGGTGEIDRIWKQGKRLRAKRAWLSIRGGWMRRGIDRTSTGMFEGDARRGNDDAKKARNGFPWRLEQAVPYDLRCGWKARGFEPGGGLRKKEERGAPALYKSLLSAGSVAEGKGFFVATDLNLLESSGGLALGL
jgi:hypothetical protein